MFNFNKKIKIDSKYKKFMNIEILVSTNFDKNQWIRAIFKKRNQIYKI